MNTENELIKKILLEYKNIATVGFSKDPTKPAHLVPKFLIEKGYNVFPVNPTASEILGRKVYKSIMEIPERIDIVQIFRPSNEVNIIVDEVIARKKRMNDVKVIWMQEGIKNDEAKKKAESEGIIVIQDRCMYKEYMKQIMGVQNPPKVEEYFKQRG
ncbi:MAG: CoA-binding protein [Sulfolobaceae archaeon]